MLWDQNIFAGYHLYTNLMKGSPAPSLEAYSAVPSSMFVTGEIEQKPKWGIFLRHPLADKSFMYALVYTHIYLSFSNIALDRFKQ